MARTIKFPVWMNEQEHQRLKAEAVRRGIAQAEVIRELISQLPEPIDGIDAECYLLSELSLAKDWLRPEEDEAWKDL